MCVQSGIREVSFLTVFTLKVPSLVVILGPPLANLPRGVLVLIFIIGIVGSIQIILTLVMIVLIFSVHLYVVSEIFNFRLSLFDKDEISSNKANEDIIRLVN